MTVCWAVLTCDSSFSRVCMCFLCTSSCIVSSSGQLRQPTPWRWMVTAAQTPCIRAPVPLPSVEEKSASPHRTSSVPWKRCVWVLINVSHDRLLHKLYLAVASDSISNHTHTCKITSVGFRFMCVCITTYLSSSGRGFIRPVFVHQVCSRTHRLWKCYVIKRPGVEAHIPLSPQCKLFTDPGKRVYKRLGGERRDFGESTSCMGKIGRDQERLLEEIFLKKIPQFPAFWAVLMTLHFY